ncbi:MAG: hypothetical protein QXP04_04990, partial [Candidatus Nanoarchaeia archaeon]|nr:hypothetical protein [Candidatus Jingweiarchaeum tengchongense]
DNLIMDKLEEALQNIEVFCRVLVEKIVQYERGIESNVAVEPMEKLLREKYVIKEDFRGKYLTKKSEMNLTSGFIPAPQIEEPLIDIFEEENRIKIIMQHNCSEPIKVYPLKNGLKVCKIICYNDIDKGKVCTEKCKELNLSIDKPIQGIFSNCNNNVLEICVNY